MIYLLPYCIDKHPRDQCISLLCHWPKGALLVRVSKKSSETASLPFRQYIQTAWGSAGYGMRRILPQLQLGHFAGTAIAGLQARMICPGMPEPPDPLQRLWNLQSAAYAPLPAPLHKRSDRFKGLQKLEQWKRVSSCRKSSHQKALNLSLSNIMYKNGTLRSLKHSTKSRATIELPGLVIAAL